MKKILLCLSLAAMCAACCYEDEYFTTWTVRNATNQTILLSPTSFAEHVYWYALAPGSEREFYHRKDYNERPAFNTLMVNWKGWADENIALEILSSDGTLLRQWKYTDRDISGRQFFNESSWDFEYFMGNGDDPRASWVFTIQPGDLD